MQGLTRDQTAARVARDIPGGACVNLGIGLPTLVANHLPAGKDILLHSENGVLGMGPAPAAREEDWDLSNAGKQPVTLLPGGAYFHHADSLTMMRGGHIDICVLGAFQVSVAGDLANWHTGEPGAIPAVGCVSRICTDLDVIDVTPEDLRLVETLAGLSPDVLQRLSGVPLIRPT